MKSSRRSLGSCMGGGPMRNFCSPEWKRYSNFCNSFEWWKISINMKNFQCKWLVWTATPAESLLSRALANPGHPPSSLVQKTFTCDERSQIIKISALPVDVGSPRTNLISWKVWTSSPVSRSHRRKGARWQGEKVKSSSQFIVWWKWVA